MNFTSALIAAGLVVICLASIYCAYLCKDQQNEFTALLSIASSVLTGMIGWLAKSPIQPPPGPQTPFRP